jgi:hypothetical protein
MDVDLALAHVERSISRALRVLYPTVPDIANLVKPHVWRDRRYVGEANNRVLSWQGRSANIQRADARMRAVYVDLVTHRYAPEMAVSLFGKDFAEAVIKSAPAIVTFVLDFPQDTYHDIIRAGFTPRVIGRKLHACVLHTQDEYLSISPSDHASRIIELLMFQRALANQRRAARNVREKISDYAGD